MAEKAFHVLKDRSEEEIEISMVTDEIVYDQFLCSGCNGTCRAEVYPVRNGLKPHFHTRKNQHHQPNCSNDHSIAALIARSLDRTGSTTSIEELFDLFSREESETESNEHKSGERKERRERGNNAKNGEEIDDDRPILHEARNPRNLKEVCALFSKSFPDDIYAGLRIGDIFIDHRNIADIRKEGVPGEKPVILLLSKISNPRREALNLKVPDDAIVLGDAYSYVDRDQQLFCVVRYKSKKIRSKILASKPGTIIAVFAKWKKNSSDKEGVYICDPIAKGQFFCAEEEFYEW